MTTLNRKTALLLFLALIFICGSGAAQELPLAAEQISEIAADSSKTINNSDFTAIEVTNLNNGRKLYKNQSLCAERLSCASTFKIALALMGFDSGVLINESSPVWYYSAPEQLPYDSWRGGQTPASWLKNSAVWYSQQITLTLGMERFDKYVHLLNYGNMDTSGNAQRGDFVANNCNSFLICPGLINCWLSSSLKISADEQSEFLIKLVDNKLPFSLRTQQLTKKIMYRETLLDDTVMYGKTGTAMYSIDGSRNLYVFWFVGFAEKGGQKYVFATNRRLVVPKDASPMSGAFANDMTKYLDENCF